MNVENLSYKPLNKTLCFKSLYVKGAFLSASLLLGACAATNDKPADTASEPPVKAEEKKAETQNNGSSPSAAELMKTLKAPLVPPPEAKPAPQKIVKNNTATPTTEAKIKAETIAPKPQDEVKAPQVVQEKVITQNVVDKEKAPEEPVKVAQNNAETPALGFSAKPFNVSANSLPFTYDIWTIKQGNTPLTQGLVISTPTWEMGKEGYTSQIWLTMMEDKIHVNSSSDIETASKGLGIRIDGGQLIEFSSIADNNIGVISGAWLNKLAAANKVDIYLGFFPGKKPTSETFSSDLSLKNLARMVATYRMLNE